MLSSGYPLSLAFVTDDDLLMGGASFTPDFKEYGSAVLWNLHSDTSPRVTRLFGKHRIDTVGVSQNGRFLAGSAILEEGGGHIVPSPSLYPSDNDVAGLAMFDSIELRNGRSTPLKFAAAGEVRAIVADKSTPISIAVIDGLRSRIVAFDTRSPEIRETVDEPGRLYAASGIARNGVFAVGQQQKIKLYQINN
jgi:hypothetical protein